MGIVIVDSLNPPPISGCCVSDLKYLNFQKNRFIQNKIKPRYVLRKYQRL